MTRFVLFLVFTIALAGGASAINLGLKIKVENVPDDKVTAFTSNVRTSMANALGLGISEENFSIDTNSTVSSLPPSPPPPPNPPPPSPPSPPPPPVLQNQLDLNAFVIPFYLKVIKTSEGIDGSIYDTYNITMNQVPGRLLANETNFVTAFDSKTTSETLTATLSDAASFYIQTNTFEIVEGFSSTTVNIIETPRTYVQNVIAADQQHAGVAKSSRISLRREAEVDCSPVTALFSGGEYTDSTFMNAQDGEELLFEVQRPPSSDSLAKKQCHALQEDVGLTFINVGVMTVPQNVVVELSFALEVR